MSDSFTLLLLMGPTLAVPVPQPVIDALTGVQVTTTAGQASGFQLGFALSKNSPLSQSLLPLGFFDPKTRVIVVVILNGWPTVLMDGVITRQDVTPSSDPGASTLTITGEDLTLLMDLEDVQTGYPGLTAEARVGVICMKYAEYGIVPAPVPTLLLDTPNPQEKIPVQSGTDHLSLLAGGRRDRPGQPARRVGPDREIRPQCPVLADGQGHIRV